MISISGFQVQGSAVALGAITGLTYGLLAVGLVIAYRSSGVINFAHAQIGWFAAAVMAAAVRNWQMPYFVAVAIALVVAAGLGAGTEAVVVRRLRRAPVIITAIATIGVAGILAGLGGAVYKNGQSSGQTYPTPPWLPQFHIGSLLVDRAQTGMLIASPIIIGALALFFRRSRYGLGILGAAANPEAARTSGISTTRLASLAWGIGGALAAYTAILVLPSESLLTGSFGSVLLLRALAAAVVGRMANLPVVMAAGVAIGVVESTVVWNYPRGGPTELLLFLVILIVLLVRPERQSRATEAARRGAFREVEAWGRLPEEVRRLPAVRALGPAVAAIALAAAVVVPSLSSNHAAFILVVILCFAMVGLSVGVVAGLGGELTFGQFALAGVGAAAAFHVTEPTGNYFLGIAAAAATAAIVAIIVELPALRIRGMMLAVSTLGFATSAEFWLFGQKWMLGSEGSNPSKPILGSITFDTGKKYYFLTLCLFVVVFWLTRNFWSGGLKRRLVAVRDNEQGARAFAVRVSLVKLQAVAFAGALAGVGGAVFAYSLTRVTPQSFLASSGIDVVAMSAVGGISAMAGPLIGVFYIIGLPSFVSLGAVAIAGTSLGWLTLLLQKPGGLAQALSPLRDSVIKLLAGRQAAHTATAPAAPPTDLPSVGLGARGAVKAASSGQGQPILNVRNITKSYAGIKAVQDVSFDLLEGETLGIIGANGAGKTTLFELISGFTKADGGVVSYLGRDVTRRSADARARLGMVRSFQDAALFPTLSVIETIALAHERLDATRFLLPIVGWHRNDRAKLRRASELADMMGLGSYADKRISELSTGTRRIVDLTCVVALEPKVLLLDEPSSGIAQRETEALHDVLVRLKEHLQATLILIEHDMPLVMSTSDRLIAMEAGRIIAEGTPETVKNDPLVIESYLGGELTVIERSTIAPSRSAPTAPRQCTATTQSGQRCRRPALDADVCAQHARANATAELVP